MRGDKRFILAALFLVLALVAITFFVAEAQENGERLAVSSGQGTLKVGNERFQINSVIVKLLPDRKAEITVVSDITVFLNGTWSNQAGSQQEIDLQFTGTESRGGFEGSGKVSLGSEGNSVTRMSLQGMSRTTKRPIEAKFEGK
jgi:hypothetical protein